MTWADELERAKASAWEAGFHAGEVYGAAKERHDPQWDMDPAPEPPANPYTMHQDRKQ
jgi:hypothetical protein